MIHHPSRHNEPQNLGRIYEESGHHGVYRQSIFVSYQLDAKFGLQLAFYRTLAVPSVADVLVSTGRIERDSYARISNTTRTMLDLVWHGLDSDRGRLLVRGMNHAHRGKSIHQADFTYILSSFMVAPYRHLDSWGWRKPLQLEKDAAHVFYAELAQRMGIRTIPGSYEVAERYLVGYEADHLRPTQNTKELVAATNAVYLYKFPPSRRRLALWALTVMLNDRALTGAMGLPSPPPVVAAAIRSGAHLHARRTARQPLARDSTWYIPCD